MMVFLNEFYKFHNLTVLSLLPDTIIRSLSEMHTESTASSCSPIMVFLIGFYMSHNLTALSKPPNTTNCSLFEMHT